jgi:hypothetical protein
MTGRIRSEANSINVPVIITRDLGAETMMGLKGVSYVLCGLGCDFFERIRG